MFWNIKNLNKVLLLVDMGSKSRVDCNVSTLNLRYYQPIQLLSFSFHKNIYNTVIFYILYLLTTNYVSIRSSFKLFYSFVLFPHNFLLYTFPNVYYFKVRNY